MPLSSSVWALPPNAKYTGRQNALNVLTDVVQHQYHVGTGPSRCSQCCFRRNKMQQAINGHCFFWYVTGSLFCVLLHNTVIDNCIARHSIVQVIQHIAESTPEVPVSRLDDMDQNVSYGNVSKRTIMM